MQPNITVNGQQVDFDWPEDVMQILWDYNLQDGESVELQEAHLDKLSEVDDTFRSEFWRLSFKNGAFDISMIP